MQASAIPTHRIPAHPSFPRSTCSTLPPSRRAVQRSQIRRAPPPPPPAPRRTTPRTTPASLSTAEDPFTDVNVVTFITRPPRAVLSSPSDSSSLNPSSPPGLDFDFDDFDFDFDFATRDPGRQRVVAMEEHAARLKFVAGTLMNRVHCHVRPLRRRAPLDPCGNLLDADAGPGSGLRKRYVRSGLSRCVMASEV